MPRPTRKSNATRSEELEFRATSVPGSATHPQDHAHTIGFRKGGVGMNGDTCGVGCGYARRLSNCGYGRCLYHVCIMQLRGAVWTTATTNPRYPTMQHWWGNGGTGNTSHRIETQPCQQALYISGESTVNMSQPCYCSNSFVSTMCGGATIIVLCPQQPSINFDPRESDRNYDAAVSALAVYQLRPEGKPTRGISTTITTLSWPHCTIRNMCINGDPRGP